MKKQYDIIVIGSGLGGLMAGAELASKGKRVLVLEQHFRVGGSATSFKRKDFIYEAGLHMTTAIEEGHGFYDLFKKCHLGEKVKYVPVPEFYHILGDSYDYTFSNDIQDNIERLSKLFPSETKGIKKYFKTIFTINDQTMKINEMTGIKRMLALLFSPLFYPKVLNSLFSTIGKFLDRIIKDERLKVVLLGNLGYYSDDPYALSLMLYAVAQTGYYRNGGAYIQGGSHHLPDAMADYITNNNGEICTMQEVTKIITEDGKAIGVEYISKRKDATVSQAFASTIIANTAIPNVSKDLLDKDTALPIEKKFGKFTIGPSIMTIYIALDKPLKELGNTYYSLVFYNNKDLTIKDMFKLNHSDFSTRPFILCDYSQVDSQLAPEGKGYLVLSLMDYLSDWEDLSESDYKFKKKQVAETLVERVCERFPDMRKHIEHVEVATAKTMKKFLKTPGGTAYGYANSPTQSLIFRPGATSHIKNLYYASAWTLPGAGFGGAMTSGQICAEQIKKRSGVVIMQFNGFSPDAQNFLYDLGENNNKAWFEERRNDYELLILNPMRKLVMDLSETMQEIDPELELRPVVNKTISRIYRDTRFSKDKSVFRTNMWINFKHPTPGWHDMPSWWIEIKPEGYTYGMGFYQASATTMHAFRDQIEKDQSAFKEVIKFFPGRPKFRLEGDTYKRKFNYFLPEEIQKWYQRKNMYLICKRPNDNELYSEEFVPLLIRRFEELAPLYNYWMKCCRK